MQTRLCITKVNDGTTAKQAGCQESDFIVQINGIRHVSHFDDVRAAVRSRPQQASDLICYSVEKGSLYSFPVDPSNAGVSFKAAPVPADMEVKIMGLFDELDGQATKQSSESAEVLDNGIVFVDEELSTPVSDEQSSVSAISPDIGSTNQVEEPKPEPQATAVETPLWETAGSKESADLESSSDQVEALLNDAGSYGSEESVESGNTGASSETTHAVDDQSNATAALESDEWPDANVDIDALVMGSDATNQASDASGSADQPSKQASSEDGGVLSDVPITPDAFVHMDDSEVIVVGEHDDPDLAREVKGFLDKTKTNGLAPSEPFVVHESADAPVVTTIDQIPAHMASEPLPVKSGLMGQVVSVSAEPGVLASCFSTRRIPIVFGPTFNGVGFSRLNYLGVVQVMVHGVASDKLITSAYEQLEDAAIKHKASGVVDCRQNIESMGINAQGDPVVLINMYGTAIRCMN